MPQSLTRRSPLSTSSTVNVSYPYSAACSVVCELRTSKAPRVALCELHGVGALAAHREVVPAPPRLAGGGDALRAPVRLPTHVLCGGGAAVAPGRDEEERAAESVRDRTATVNANNGGSGQSCHFRGR